MSNCFNNVVNRLGYSFPALKSKNYRYFWFGQCISLIGTWMQRTAQQWLVYTLTKSAFLLGILGVAQFGPMLLFSLFAGAFIDRYPKKKILITTQVVLMVQAIALGVLVWSEKVVYWQVLLLAVILGFANTLDMPTRQSYVVELVGKEHLINGIALNSAIVNIARIAGPALSAILMAHYGAAFCFFLNGVSFIPVLIGLALIRVKPNNQPKKKVGIIKGILDGLRYIAKKPIILSAILALVIVGTFVMNLEVIIPVFADKVLHKGAHGYGFLLSASGVGALIGALFVATKVKKNPKPKVIFGSAIILAILLCSAFFIRNYAVAILVVAFIGLFNMIFMSLVNSTVQLNSDDNYRGRVMSIYTLAFAGTTPLGNLFTGSVIQKFGVPIGFLSCGVITALLIFTLIAWMAAKRRGTAEC